MFGHVTYYAIPFYSISPTVQSLFICMLFVCTSPVQACNKAAADSMIVRQLMLKLNDHQHLKSVGGIEFKPRAGCRLLRPDKKAEGTIIIIIVCSIQLMCLCHIIAMSSSTCHCSLYSIALASIKVTCLNKVYHNSS